MSACPPVPNLPTHAVGRKKDSLRQGGAARGTRVPAWAYRTSTTGQPAGAGGAARTGAISDSGSTRTIQEPLGHRDMTSTMMYTQVFNRTGRRPQPLDR